MSEHKDGAFCSCVALSIRLSDDTCYENEPILDSEVNRAVDENEVELKTQAV